MKNGPPTTQRRTYCSCKNITVLMFLCTTMLMTVQRSERQTLCNFRVMRQRRRTRQQQCVPFLRRLPVVLLSVAVVNVLAAAVAADATPPSFSFSISSLLSPSRPCSPVDPLSNLRYHLTLQLSVHEIDYRRCAYM